MKIVYCGYDFFGACLEELINEGHEIIQLFTQAPDGIYKFNDHVLSLAKEYNIPVYDKKPTEEMIIDLFKNKGADLLISAGFKYIVPTPENVGFRGVNVHPAMLPVGRGGWPIPIAILNREKELGVTLHEIIRDMDAGDILLQEGFALSDNEDLDTLCCKCQMLAKKLVKKLTGDFSHYWENKRPQGDGAVIWDPPTKENQSFTGEMTVEEVDRKVRAFGRTGTFVSFEGENWVVYDATCWKESHEYEPGSVAHRSHYEVVLALKDGFICLRYFSKVKGDQ